MKLKKSLIKRHLKEVRQQIKLETDPSELEFFRALEEVYLKRLKQMED